jgi:serine/threonine protein phosphatase 1
MLRLRSGWALIARKGIALIWLAKLLGRTPRIPKVAANKRVYAIGDIHGRRDLLDGLLECISAHAKANQGIENTLVFLGDYIDRGPDSCAVVERLRALPGEFPDWKFVFLRGNHDQTALEFIDDPKVYGAWRAFGAAETLLSYGVMPPRFENEEDFVRARDAFAHAVPLDHFRFLNRLKYFHVEDDYFFVHAGVRPGIALVDQAQEDMLWIREEFLLHRKSFGKFVVHGHTPGPSPVTLSNRVCVDTGAHATGRLTALVMEGESRSFLHATDKVAPPSTSRGPVITRRLEAVQS